MYFHAYLYGHTVTIITDHTAIKTVLETQNPSGKHARWWSMIYGWGIKDIKIIHHSDTANLAADALWCNLRAPEPVEGIGQGEVQISEIVHKELPISELLKASPAPGLSTDNGEE